MFVARGEGAELIDVDGNRYVDWVMSWGPLIAGHAHPEVVAAVTAAAARRHQLRRADRGRGGPRRRGGGAHPSRRDGAHDLVGHRGRHERHAPGPRGDRPRPVVKFAGAYHGHVDGLLAEAGSGLATQGIPASPGVTEAQAADTRGGALERPRGGRARSASGESRRIVVRALPREHGPRAAGAGLPGLPARARARHWRAARLRRGDHRLPRRSRRRPGARGRDPGPDDSRQGDRRRPARGGLRRARAS